MYTALIFIYFFGKWVRFSNIWLSFYYWQTESSPSRTGWSFSFAFSALFSSYPSSFSSFPPSFSSFPSSFSYSSPPPITVFPSSSCQWLSMGSWSSPNIACVNSFSLNSASIVKYFSAVEYHLARPRHRCKKPFQSTLQWIDWRTNEWSPENH